MCYTQRYALVGGTAGYTFVGKTNKKRLVRQILECISYAYLEVLYRGDSTKVTGVLIQQ